MPTLNELKTFIYVLNKEEIKIVRKNLQDEETILLNLVLGKNLKKIEQQVSTWGGLKTKKIINSFYTKSLNSVVNTDPYPLHYSPTAQGKLKVRLALLHSQYLFSKNLIHLVFSMYNKTIHIAKKYECYDELMIILYELLNLYTAYILKEEYLRTQKEIELFKPIQVDFKRAHYLFNQYGFESNFEKPDKQLADKIIEEFRAIAERSPSQYVQFLYLRTLIRYQEQNAHYKEGLDTARKFINLSSKQFFFNSSVVRAIAYKMLGLFHAYLYDFDKAFYHLNKAMRIDQKSKHNKELILEIKFKIHLYKGDYKRAYEELSFLQSATDSEFYKSVYAYNQDCVRFLEDKQPELNPTNTKALEKSKQEWNIHIKLFFIINFIERNKTDLAQTQVENLRKYIERLAIKKEPDPRIVAILKVLKELVNKNFNFALTLKKQEKNLLLLNSTDLPYKWQMFSPELIRFDVWFESKLRKLPYQVVFDEYIENEKNKNISEEK